MQQEYDIGSKYQLIFPFFSSGYIRKVKNHAN